MTTNAEAPKSNHADDSGDKQPKQFPYRVDFYWQALAMYLIALALYAFVAGSVESGFLTFAIDDPIVILLAILIVQSTVTLAIQSFMRRSLTITEDTIIIRNRWRVRKFGVADIKSISLRRDRFQRALGTSKLIRIRLHERRRALRIRPGLYDFEEQLTSAMRHFKQSHNL
jgi:hypothetical protein